MLLLWLGSYPKPLGVLHVEGHEAALLTGRQRAEYELLLITLLEEDTLTLEDTWQVTIE